MHISSEVGNSWLATHLVRILLVHIYIRKQTHTHTHLFTSLSLLDGKFVYLNLNIMMRLVDYYLHCIYMCVRNVDCYELTSVDSIRCIDKHTLTHLFVSLASIINLICIQNKVKTSFISIRSHMP